MELFSDTRTDRHTDGHTDRWTDRRGSRNSYLDLLTKMQSYALLWYIKKLSRPSGRRFLMEKGIFLCKEANTSSHDKDDDVWLGSFYICARAYKTFALLVPNLLNRY